jgi:hypothetical protein
VKHSAVGRDDASKCSCKRKNKSSMTITNIQEAKNQCSVKCAKCFIKMHDFSKIREKLRNALQKAK